MWNYEHNIVISSYFIFNITINHLTTHGFKYMFCKAFDCFTFILCILFIAVGIFNFTNYNIFEQEWTMIYEVK